MVKESSLWIMEINKLENLKMELYHLGRLNKLKKNATYKSQIKNKMPNGYGTAISIYGEKYEGCFKYGEYHRKGTCATSDGS